MFLKESNTHKKYTVVSSAGNSGCNGMCVYVYAHARVCVCVSKLGTCVNKLDGLRSVSSCAPLRISRIRR